MHAMERKTANRQGPKASAAPPVKKYAAKPLPAAEGAVANVLWMQQTLGNQATQRRVSSCGAFSTCPTGGACHDCPYPVQAKARVSQSSDPDQQEADRVAGSVTNAFPAAAPESLPLSGPATGTPVRSACVDCENEETHAQTADSDGALAMPVRPEADVAATPTPSEPEALPEPNVSDESSSPAVQVAAEHNAETTQTIAPTTPSAEGQVSRVAPSPSDQVTDEPKITQTPTDHDPGQETVASSEPAPTTFIVADSTREVEPHQMKKSEFLVQLQAGVHATAEAALAGTGWSPKDCPYIERWFSFYNTKDSRHVERAIRKYAPETATAVTTREVTSAILERVRRAVEIWAKTGQVTGVPEDLPTELPGGIPEEEGSKRAASGTGKIFFKARDGGPREADDPRAIQSRLGPGSSLNGGVRSRMESAFGYDFSHVRVHTDAGASKLSHNMNARAFTVGSDIAFGSGEYQPGTMIGDALIAHELAHVVQQRGSSSSASAIETSENSPVEQDADRSAVSAMVTLWGKGRGALSSLSQSAMPCLRSGLRLSRCSTPKPDGCVTGNLTAHTSGAFQGGWDANSYLGGGMTWRPLTSPGTAGSEGGSYKVQMTAPYTGNENLGVSQTMQHGNSNQNFLDGTAAYLGKAAGSVRNGDVNPEPVLDASNPFASRNWFLRYKDNIVSFADVPGALAGDQGYIDFVTCFHSKGIACTYKKCCVTWRWSVDFTGGNTTNTASQQSQQCSA